MDNNPELQMNDSKVALNTLYLLVKRDPLSALVRMKEFDALLGSDIHYAAFRPGVLIDAGASLDDPILIQEGVDELAALLDAGHPRIQAWRRSLFYNLGNGYSELTIRKRRPGHDPDDLLLQKTKHAFREAIAANNGDGNLHLEAEIFTNYGNALSACGRHYEALLAYDEALRAEPTHSMALGNKGIELSHYAYLSRQHAGLLLAESYELLRTAAGDQGLDHRGLAEARAMFAARLDALESLYFEEREHLQSARAKQEADIGRTREEQHHHQFAADNGLYLNLCVHDWPCTEKHADGLFFLEYVAPVDDPYAVYRLARYFNQAKEDYATARYLFAEAARPTPRRQRLSDWTHYADVLEYADYGLTGGLAKTAFALAYNILDKIAVFLKWDLDLPESEEDITFRKVWHPDRQVRTLRPEIQAKDAQIFLPFMTLP
jgi:hypothetical protein